MSSPLDSHSAKPQKKSIFARPVFLGCMGIVLLFIIAVGVGLFWLFTSGKTVISNGMRDAVVSEIEESELPFEQQQALMREIDRITEGFQEGEISMKDMVQILEALEQSPAMSIVRYYEVQGNPLDRDSISPEQKQAAMLTIRRFVYGVFEGKIPETAVEDLIEPFILEESRDQGIENLEFRPDISDEELFAALDKAKGYADNAGIQNENLSPDIAREVRAIVDRILAGRE